MGHLLRSTLAAGCLTVAISTPGLALDLSVAGDNLTSPPNPEGVTEIAVKFVLIDLEGVNSALQSFTANLVYAARWHDPRLRHDALKPASVELERIWHPRLEIINRQRLQNTLPPSATITSASSGATSP